MASSENEYQTALGHIKIIAQSLRGSALKRKKRKSIAEQAKLLSAALGCNKKQALVFALVSELNATESAVTLDELAVFLGCPAERLSDWRHVFQALVEKNLLTETATADPNANVGLVAQLKYAVSQTDFNQLFSPNTDENKETETLQPAENNATGMIQRESLELIEDIFDLIENRSSDETATKDLLKDAAKLFAEHKKSTIAQKIKPFATPPEDGLMLCWILYRLLKMDSPYNDLDTIAEDIFDKFADQVSFKARILGGNCKAIKDGWLAFDTEDDYGSRYLKLTPQAISELAGAEFQSKDGAAKQGLAMKAADIPTIKLFYNPAEEKQVGFLADLLDDAKYTGIVKRLRDNNQKTGLTILLHGHPGTGKTETVLQLARQSGRAIKQVEMSSVQSKWLGESEKNVKQIFEQYKMLLRRADRTPILLFNEADALLSKRLDVAHSIDQLHNTIQNILLQELESFEGILFATTNLTGNLDKAFERRFLFKVKFEQPSTEVKAQIWHSKLPELPLESCARLAERFTLSGGEIENIARKYLFSQLLYDREVNFETVVSFCEAEGWGGKRAVGFNQEGRK